MDGDSSAKTFDEGAKNAAPTTELNQGVQETGKPGGPSIGEKTTGTGTSAFDKDGAIGKQFNADGAIGGTAQKIGGPFDKEGAIGQHFNADGAIGGAVQKNIAESGS